MLNIFKCFPLSIVASCSHFRAVVLFTTTINPVCIYRAHKCWRYITFRLGFCNDCRKTSCIKMGYDVPLTARGRYYVRTSGKNPFCRKSLFKFAALLIGHRKHGEGGGVFHSRGTCGCAAAKVYFLAILVEFSLGKGILLAILVKEITKFGNSC